MLLSLLGASVRKPPGSLWVFLSSKITKEALVQFHVKLSAIERTIRSVGPTAACLSGRADVVLDIRFSTALCITGSGMKDGKIEGRDFFDAERDP